MVAFDKFLAKALKTPLRQFLSLQPLPTTSKKAGLSPGMEMMFSSFIELLKTELSKNGEAGFRALRGVLRDKHYEKLLEHILYSEAIMNNPARYLLLQLL